MQEASGARMIFAAGHIVLAVSILGLIDNFVRLIAAEAGLWQFHLVRSVMVALVLLPCARLFGWRLRPKRWGAVVLRSFCLSGAMVLYFGSLAFMPIAQVGAGLFTSPIFVLLISVTVLGVRIGLWRMLAVALGFAGVMLVLRPDTGDASALMLVPVGAGFLYAISVVVTRRLCAEEGVAALQAGFFAGLAIWAVFGLVAVNLVLPEPGAAFVTRGWVAPTGAFLFWTAVQAAGSLVALGVLTRGYQMAEPTYLAVFEYVFLISAGFWAWDIWGEVLAPSAYAGIILIATSGIIIGLRSGAGPAGLRRIVKT